MRGTVIRDRVEGPAMIAANRVITGVVLSTVVYLASAIVRAML